MPVLCSTSGRNCGSFRPGHNMHVIPATRVGGTPWGWRDATVIEVEPNGRLVMAYAGRATPLTAWHHVDLTAELWPGCVVEVHEQYGALAGPLGWISVKVKGGIGPVPAPRDVTPWLDQMTSGVVDLSTGRGIELRPCRRDVTPDRNNDNDRGF